MPNSAPVICSYCFVKSPADERICPSCGAPLPVKTVYAQKPESKADMLDEIKKACEEYEGFDYWKPVVALSQGRIRKVYRELNIPQEERLLIFYDNSVLERSKNGFAVGEAGLYWENAWFTSTNRHKLSWRELVEREIKVDVKEQIVDLGRGDLISVLDDDDNVRVHEFLLRLQEIVKASLQVL